MHILNHSGLCSSCCEFRITNNLLDYDIICVMFTVLFFFNKLLAEFKMEIAIKATWRLKTA
jgi:hypothetical protein